MLKLLQVTVGLFILVLVVPQTPTDNIVLRKISESGIFTTYNQAKNVLKIITWILFIGFLVITCILHITTKS